MAKPKDDDDDIDAAHAANTFAWQGTGVWLGNSDENPDPSPQSDGCKKDAFMLIILASTVTGIAVASIKTALRRR